MSAVYALPEDILKDIVDRIVRECDPAKIILFGSHARGAAGPDSDVDLLVVEDEPFGGQRPRYHELVRLERALGRIAIPVDLLVYSLDEIEYWRDAINHVVPRALREGRTVYERH